MRNSATFDLYSSNVTAYYLVTNIQVESFIKWNNCNSSNWDLCTSLLPVYLSCSETKRWTCCKSSLQMAIFLSSSVRLLQNVIRFSTGRAHSPESVIFRQNLAFRQRVLGRTWLERQRRAEVVDQQRMAGELVTYRRHVGSDGWPAFAVDEERVFYGRFDGDLHMRPRFSLKLNAASHRKNNLTIVNVTIIHYNNYLQNFIVKFFSCEAHAVFRGLFVSATGQY